MRRHMLHYTIVCLPLYLTYFGISRTVRAKCIVQIDKFIVIVSASHNITLGSRTFMFLLVYTVPVAL